MKARVNIENFAGEVPHTSDRLLAPNFASVAENVKLHSGELRGIRQLSYLTTVAGAQRVYRIPDPLGVGGVTWTGFTSLDEYLLPGPLLNDADDRFYKFGNGAPCYNTLARIRNGDPWYLLGVPTPSATGTMTPTGGSAANETRFYVYTFVSAYGEEGPPSTPVSATGPSDASWDYASMDTTVPDSSQRNITHKNIYRTVSGFANTEFFYVGQTTLASATYSDTASSDTVSRNNLLESEGWVEPPSTLEGAIAHPNGFFISWTGRDVYFSETYRPHAWPAAYQLSTEFDVQGGGIFGQSAGLVTDGNPYIGTGATPSAFVLTKTSTVAPGLSKYGIVTQPYGVLYPSHDGIMSLGPNGATLATRQLLTKNEWVDFQPESLKAAEYQAAYIGFYSSSDGLLIDPADPRAMFVQLANFAGVDNIQTDPYTGDVFIILSGDVYEWDSTSAPRGAYTWKSKDFSFRAPVNLGAASIEASSDATSTAPDEADALAAATAWNAARFAAGPLDMLGGSALGLGITNTLSPPNDTYKVQNQFPLGGSPLIDLDQFVTTLDSVILTVYADGTEVFSELWQGQNCIRLPSGLKSDTWTFQLRGKRSIYSLHVAETCRGLKDV